MYSPNNKYLHQILNLRLELFLIPLQVQNNYIIIIYAS